MSRALRRQCLVLSLLRAMLRQLPGERRLHNAVNEAWWWTWSPSAMECGARQNRRYEHALAALGQTLERLYPDAAIEALELLNAALLVVADQVAELPPTPRQRHVAWQKLLAALQELVERRDPELASGHIERGAQVGQALRQAVEAA